LRLEPNDVVNYSNLAAVYANLNQLDEEEAVYKQAEERKLDSELLLSFRLLAAQAETQAWSGKMKNARELTRRHCSYVPHRNAGLLRFPVLMPCFRSGVEPAKVAVRSSGQLGWNADCQSRPEGRLPLLTEGRGASIGYRGHT
jgi:hypothetical protein